MGNTSSHGLEKIKHASKLLSWRQSKRSNDSTWQVIDLQNHDQLDQPLHSISFSNSHSLAVWSYCNPDQFNGYRSSMQPVRDLGLHAEHHNYTLELRHVHDYHPGNRRGLTSQVAVRMLLGGFNISAS